jgi:hypothetical protein
MNREVQRVLKGEQRSKGEHRNADEQKIENK